MITLNRIYSLYIDSYESSLATKLEWGYDTMRSDKAKQIRKDVVKEKIPE